MHLHTWPAAPLQDGDTGGCQDTAADTAYESAVCNLELNSDSDINCDPGMVSTVIPIYDAEWDFGICEGGIYCLAGNCC